ncbi:CLIP-associating protein 1-A isoform X3 [Cimex lectularius]|uniref:TOG domain-containing protein n=1 Tax=Cimex lectularius TaxID=79782 RepID=A0A8I6TK33_CIMLE|nr:CLIP-associating protein 1-A isoform X3 [Cimex lectularius]
MVKDMDSYLPLISNTTDTKQKLVIGQELLLYLQRDGSIECQDIGHVVDSLIPWMQCSNSKVSQMGLDLMTELAKRMEHYFKPYIPTVVPSVIDRLGDSKELIRDRCQLLLSQLMDVGVITPQSLFDRLHPAFSHKNSYVRDEIMKCLNNTLNQHGASCISVSRLVPNLVKLLSDPNAAVRDNALSTLANVYRHVGEKLRTDLIKKQSVPPTKMPILMAKFDEIKTAGDFFPTATASNNLLEEDETDRLSFSTAPKRPPNSGSTLKRNVSSVSAKSVTPAGSNTAAGAVDEEGFIRAFEAVPTVQIFSLRDLEDNLNKIKQVISDTDQDWNKRVDAIKKIRSLLIAGANSYDEFLVHLRQLDQPFQLSVKDLRSQVVREACVTIAFMSQELGNRFDIFADSMLPVLINLIQNSAKVVASAGQVCIGFIVKNTPSSRLLPHICAASNHKSREIRRASIKYLLQIISSWPTSPLHKHLTQLQNALSSAITDADQEVRLTARKVYWAFKEHFPEQADILLNNLDANYKRSLHSDMSNSSSSNSLNQPTPSSKSRPPPGITGGSMENLTGSGYGRRSSGSSIPVLHKGESTETPVNRRGFSTPKPVSLRSNSAVDLQAAQRAKARAQYAAMARQKVGSNASLPRPKKTTDSGPSSLVGAPSSSLFSPEHSRQGRKTTRVSQSQPSSRSGSPSSRLNYGGYGTNSAINDRSRRSPSFGGSRETSPGRSGTSLMHHHPHHHPLLPPLSLKGRSSMSGRSMLPTRPPIMSQRVLQQSLEAESALADALTYEPRELSMVTSPRRIRGLDDPSDDSETSSVCSERSFESSHRRTSDEIMQAFDSTHWSDRKEGLVSLSVYLQDGNTLSPHQLTRITEHFTKMLSDSHTKVFGLFLDTVNDLIKTHSSDLRPWLYVLLTRLFNKLGSDLLTSIQGKIARTLDTVRDSFGAEAVLHWALRFLVDPTQTPNTRVKLAVLQFLAKTAPNADPMAAFPVPSGGSSRDITTAALTKLIGWTMGDSIKQGSELRRASQEAILALFNLNPSQVTLRFTELPKEYQEAAASLIQCRVRKPVSNSESTPVSSKSETPLSPDQVYRSLRRTTAEIQSYSYDGKVTDTASHDSGISQMSLNEKQDVDLITNWTTSLSLSSPTKAQKDCNGIDSTDSNSLGNGFSMNDGGSTMDGDLLGKTLDTLDSLAGEEKKLAVSLVATLVKESDPVVISHHFKRVLRVILPLIDAGDVESRQTALLALSEMLKKKTLGPMFQSYSELLILNIIRAYSDTNRDIAKHAEPCIEEMANALKPDLVMKVLIPLMSVESFPHNLSVIKALTKVVEAHPKQQFLPFLSDLMPGLIQAYGHEESLVRKSAVFCMVALHDKLGDGCLRPYLSTLSASKLKLLDLYINKKHPSGPNSPKSSSSSTSSTPNNTATAATAAHV